MLDQPARRPGSATWSVDDIRFDQIDPRLIAADAQLFYMLVSASFVEITSDLYTRNLTELFAGDAEITDWLAHGWEPEELQHGMALKRYVQAAWPDFDWDGAYRNFLGDYSHYCSVDQLAPNQTLEMLARCVVETGTASFYSMLSQVTVEPVLKQLADHIRSDEVRHYKHFYHYFLRYAEREPQRRTAIMRTLWSRLAEIDEEDALLSFKHVYLARNPGAEFGMHDYALFRNGIQQMAMRHFPYAMAARMLVKPLGFSALVNRLMMPVITATGRFLFLARLAYRA